jgi:hypothetical protein
MMPSRLPGHAMRHLCCIIAALVFSLISSRAEAAIVVQIDRGSQAWP